MRATGGVTNVSPVGCLANNVLTASVTDNTTLGFSGYYLMKTAQSCTVALSGAFSESLPDEIPGAGGTRDTDIAGSPNACP